MTLTHIIILIALGNTIPLIVVGVIIWNKIQDYRFKKALQRANASGYKINKEKS